MSEGISSNTPSRFQYAPGRRRAKLSSHGRAETKEYHVWEAMLYRCYNPRCKGYQNYGGRGITVCERWKESFINFFADMGECPPGRSIDRIDNDGNYEPGNCRWTTRQVQSGNRRLVRYLELNGERLVLAEWARRLNLPESTIRNRLRRGWSDKRTLTEPIGWNTFRGPKPKG